jgi:hypothetical protein
MLSKAKYLTSDVLVGFKVAVSTQLFKVYNGGFKPPITRTTNFLK